MGRAWVCLGQVMLAGILVAGCGTNGSRFSAVPGGFAGDGKNPDRERFQPGDKVNIIFSGISEPLPAHEENIKDDGTITMPNIGPVPALGKTPGELQRDIFNLYVPKYYRSNLNVTVTAPERLIYLGGEVRGPNRYVYTGGMTVLKAIQSAGDFTEFANKRKVKLTRADGTVVTVNCLKALEDATKDLAVFPGDKIYVPRRLF